MIAEELNPFIRHAKLHNFYYEQKELSVCYDCRLFYLLKGDGIFIVNGQKYAFTANTAVYLPPETRYTFKFNDKSAVQIFVLNFDLTDKFNHFIHSFGTATESTFNKEKVLPYSPLKEFSQPIIQENCLDIINNLASCIDLFLLKTYFYKHLASANLKLALINLLSRHRNSKGEYSLIQSVQNYVKNNYNDFELNNSSIAERFNYHPYHLNRIMKKHTKKTLHGYLLEYRIHMAKNYLTTTSLNVTEIAEKTGFASYTYFIKTFREQTGLSPLKYRKTHENIGF